MAARNFIPNNNIKPGQVIAVEKHLLLRHYPFLKIDSLGNSITCTGTCQPTEFSVSYTYQFRYTPGKHPNVYVKSPEIPYDEEIHMYPHDNSLCLDYWKDFSWTPESHLHNTIIPWTHEWFLFYELYQIYGEWRHPAVQHTSNNKQKN